MQKIKKFIISFSLLVLVGPLAFSATARADSPPATGPCANITSTAIPTCTQCHNNKTTPSLCACHPEYYYGQALSSGERNSCIACNKPGLSYDQRTRTCLKGNSIVGYINLFINVLAALATMVVIGVLIFGGIRYSMAGTPQAATNARKTIINGLAALFAFWFVWALAQWLIPGGL